MGYFYVSENNCFITVDGHIIKVPAYLFEAYKKSHYQMQYSDRKYCRWNRSIDSKGMDCPKCGHTVQHKPSAEESYISQETIEEFFERLNSKEKKILKLLIDGYSEREIGKKIGMSKQAINKHKQKMKRLFAFLQHYK